MNYNKITILIIVILFRVVTLSSGQAKKIAEIGAPIASESAISWTENYKSTFPKSPAGFAFGRNMVENLLSIEKVEGFYVLNALDKEGNLKFIFRAADAKGELLKSAPYTNGKICPPNCQVKKEQGGQMDTQVAEDWIARFQEKYPNQPKGWLFGIEAALNIIAQFDIEAVYFANAIKDNKKQTIVMVGIDKTGTVLWNDKPVDNAHSCPPDCPKQYEGNSVTAKK